MFVLSIMPPKIKMKNLRNGSLESIKVNSQGLMIFQQMVFNVVGVFPIMYSDFARYAP